MQSATLKDQPSAAIASAMTRLAIGSLSTSTPSQSKTINSGRNDTPFAMPPPVPRIVKPLHRKSTDSV